MISADTIIRNLSQDIAIRAECRCGRIVVYHRNRLEVLRRLDDTIASFARKLRCTFCRGKTRLITVSDISKQWDNAVGAKEMLRIEI